MKKIILTFVILFTINTYSQNANIISQNDFNNIEINNVKFQDLANTYGNLNSIENLLGTASSKKLDPDGNSFKFPGLSIGFSALLSDDYNTPVISRIELTSSNSTLTIKDVKIKLGDSINKLGTIVFNTMTNGSKSILYTYCDGCSSYFSIDFNQSTKLITKIVFIELT